MKSVIKRFAKDKKANAAMMVALALIPIVGVIGMSVDYTMAGRREAQINAIADAAALSTTTPAAMTLPYAIAQANAILMFNSQIANMNGVAYSPSNLTINVNDAQNASTMTRSTVVTYTANSQNAFSSLLHMNTIAIGGTSSATNSTAANIDFYLMLDTSPSMAIPSNQTDIATLVANTSQQGGCAFACHEYAPSGSDNKGNPGGEDNYALARQLGLTLRIDLIQQAAASLITTAQATALLNKAKYRVSTSTFDQSLQTITSLTTNLPQAQIDATNKIQMLEVWSENYLNKLTANYDEDTQFDPAMQSLVAFIPNAGKGTGQPGDSPQEVLFIVTDGVIDEAYPGYGSFSRTSSGGRTVSTIGDKADYCTQLKQAPKNVRIAVLYTTYNPLPGSAFYNSNIGSWQPTIATSLQTCASPGLFFQVDTGGDIVGAMLALFSKAVATAHLTQ